MHIIVQGKHLDVTPALREYAEEKVGRLTRFFDQVQEAQVVLSVERRDGVGKAQVVEVTVWGDGIVLRGEEASADMYASIDLVFDKLRKQIEKYRSKLIERRRISESRRKDRLAAGAREAERSADIPAQMESPIIRMKRFAMKPMTPDEAVMQMDLLGHGFFVFRNSGTMEVNVVYRRTDGKFGLIEQIGRASCRERV